MPAEPEPDSARVRAPRRKRWFRRLLLGLLCAPPLLLGLGNVVLATPWMKHRVAAAIQRRCGLEAEVGSMTVTPWGGAEIGELRLLQPEPLRAVLDRPVLDVRSIRVVPRWRPLFRGDLQIEEIRVEHPQGAVAVEMLASLAGSMKGPPATPPAVIAAADPVAPVAGSAAPAPAGGEPVVPAPASPQPPAIGLPKAPEESVPAPPPAPAAVPGVPRDTSWLVIEEGDVDFYLGGRKAGSLSGFGGRIPVKGRPATGSITLGAAGLFGREIVSGAKLSLDWADPTLRVLPAELVVAGVKLQVQALAGLMHGIPVEMEIRAPEQAADLGALMPGSRAEFLNGGIRAQGFLAVPATWQGFAAFESRHLALATGAQTLLFGEASGHLLVQGGSVSCPELRVIGESVSFLGNGSFHGGEGITLVLRAVMPPELAESWRRRAGQAGATVPPVFSGMEAAGRVYIDLRWVSYSGGQGIEFGSGGPVMPIEQALVVFGAGV